MIARPRLLAKLAADITRDHAQYLQLRNLLETLHEQLSAMRAEEIAHSNGLVDVLLTALAARARLRRQVLTALGGGQDRAAMLALFEEFTGNVGASLKSRWASLERTVAECQRLNERNGELLRRHRTAFQALCGESASATLYQPSF